MYIHIWTYTYTYIYLYLYVYVYVYVYIGLTRADFGSRVIGLTPAVVNPETQPKQRVHPGFTRYLGCVSGQPPGMNP